jgi:hypothetical protein
MDERTQQMTPVDVSVVSIEAQGRSSDASVQVQDANITAEARLESWDGTNLDIRYRFVVEFRPKGLFSLKLGVRALYKCTGCEEISRKDLLKKAAEQFYPAFATAALSIAQISQSMGYPPLMIPYGDERLVVELKDPE